MKGLKNCPFCNCDPILELALQLYGSYRFIRCHNCGGRGPTRSGVAGAVQSWNHRAGERRRKKPEKECPAICKELSKALRKRRKA